MPESVSIPILNQSPTSLSGVRFCIKHGDSLSSFDVPDKDPLHIHDCIEIYFNVIGDVTFLVNNRLYPISPGDIVVSMPNDVHVCLFNSKARHEYYSLWLDVGECAAIRSLFDGNHSPRYSFNDPTREVLSDLFRRLYELSDGGSELKKTVSFLRIMTAFDSEECERGNALAVPPEFQLILDEIDERFAEINNAADIHSARFISHSTLYRMFRKYTRSSPHAYIESRKLSNAAKLLSGGATVTEACLASGFSDCSRFIILFKRKFGETPLQYKRSF